MASTPWMPVVSCQSWWPGVSRQCHTPLRGNYPWTRTSDIKFSTKKPCLLATTPLMRLFISQAPTLFRYHLAFSHLSLPSILFSSHCLSHCLRQGSHLHQLAAVLGLPAQKNSRVEGRGTFSTGGHMCSATRDEPSTLLTPPWCTAENHYPLPATHCCTCPVSNPLSWWVVPPLPSCLGVTSRRLYLPHPPARTPLTWPCLQVLPCSLPPYFICIIRYIFYISLLQSVL